MKKLLLAGVAFTALFAGSAFAADLTRPAYRAAPPPPPMYSWTGLYWGVNVGYSWGRDKNTWTLNGVGTLVESQKMDGVIGGFQSGYNYQFGQWVLGLETDIQASGQKGSSTYFIPGLPGTTITAEHKLPWFGTSRTRLGVLISPTTLLYGTAGVAYGQVKQNYTLSTVGFGSAFANFKDVRAGWTAGAGVEGVIGGGWTAKLEYLYIDLGEQTATLGVPGTQLASWNTRTTDNIVRVGFNYRWGGGAY
jgi:outer membrane immunogenic protein